MTVLSVPHQVTPLAGAAVAVTATRLSSTTRTPRPHSAFLFFFQFLIQAQKALTKAGASKQVTQAVLDENQQARLDGLRTPLAALAFLALIALFFSTRIPTRSPDPPRGNPNLTRTPPKLRRPDRPVQAESYSFFWALSQRQASWR